MLIAKLKSGNEIEKIAPYTEFGGFTDIPTRKNLEEQGFRIVSSRKAFDFFKEKLVECEPYLEEPWVYNVKVEPLSDAEVLIKQQTVLNQIRNERDALLAASDWTQLPDLALTPEELGAWRTYRQKLRDMTENIIDFNAIVWPTKPE